MMKRLMFLILSLAVLIGMGLATSAAIAGEGPFGEGRVMWWGYKDLDRNSDTDDNWAETLARFRLGYGAHIGERGFYKVAFENTRVLGGDWRGNDYPGKFLWDEYDFGFNDHNNYGAIDNDAVVIHNAIIGMKDFLFEDFTMAVGRFGNLNLGRGRVIGPNDWNIYGQNRFDGFLGKYMFDSGWLALLCLKLQETGPTRYGTTFKNRPTGDHDLRGAYLHYDVNENAYVEPYVFWRTQVQSDVDVGEEDPLDLDNNSMFIFGALGDYANDTGLHLYGEFILQNGTEHWVTYETKQEQFDWNLSAMGFYVGAFYTIGDSEMEPYIGAEFNLASGTPYDEETDNKTFQRMWGSYRDFLGKMNAVPWSNSKAIRVSGGLTPMENMDVSLDYWMFSLAEKPSEDGKTGIGSEIDIIVDCLIEDGLWFEAGLGLFSYGELFDPAEGSDDPAPDSSWMTWLGMKVAFPGCSTK